MVVDVVPAASSSSSSAAPPALLPRVPAGGVGTTALEASALPALDAAVSLPVDPSSSASSGGAGGGVGAAAAPLSAAAPSSAPSTSLFFSVPPAVRGMLAINLGAALFGSNMVAVKLAQGAGASPAALSAGRFALAAAVFLPSAVSALWPPQEGGGGRESREDETEKEELKEEDSKRRGNPPAAASPSLLAGAGLELGLYLFGGYTGQAIGLSLTTASKGAFASAFTVLAVPILQAAAAALEGGRGG